MSHEPSVITKMMMMTMMMIVLAIADIYTAFI